MANAFQTLVARECSRPLGSPKTAPFWAAMVLLKKAQQELAGGSALVFDRTCPKCKGTGVYVRAAGMRDVCAGTRNGFCEGGKAASPASVKAHRASIATLGLRFRVLALAVAKAAGSPSDIARAELALQG